MKKATYSQQLAISFFVGIVTIANFEIISDSECHHGKQVFLSASPVLASLFMSTLEPHLIVSPGAYFPHGYRTYHAMPGACTGISYPSPLTRCRLCRLTETLLDLV